MVTELHERMKKGCQDAFEKIMPKFDEIAIYGEDIFLSKEGFIKMCDYTSPI